MDVNTISRPLRGQEGYYILKLVSKRKSTGVAAKKVRVILQQLFIPLRENASSKEIVAVQNQAKRISLRVKSCSALNNKAKELGSRQSGRLEINDIEQLPINIKNVVQNIELSEASKPIRARNGFIVLMVCKRIYSDNEKNIKIRIKNLLLEQQAVLTDKRMLRNIRRAAFLNIRR